MITFEFDENKSHSNLEKHGIDFVAAQQLWNDADLLEIPAKTTDEPRFLVIGKIFEKHWSAVITYRSINVRIMTGHEKKRSLYMKADEFDEKFEEGEDILDTLGRRHQAQSAFFDTPILAIKEFLALYDEEIKDWKQQSFVLQPNESDDIWRAQLKGDFSVFSRVVRNLLHNAMKFSKNSARIDVVASFEGNFWKLTVSNPGQLSTEDLRQCFIPFAKSAQPSHDGSHIGLAANRELVQQIGGTLILDNKKPNLITAEIRWPIHTGE